jgi:predicted MFS family arabinose efflux permease
MHSSAYHQNSSVTGLFGLIGAAGALLAPWTGRWADKKNPQQLVGFATVLVVISFAILVLAHSIWFLIVGVVILDLGVQSALIANQTQIYGLKADAHSRMNTIFMTCYFTGGSLGSWVGGWAWNHFEWTGVCCVGLGFSSLALLSQKLSVFARAWSPLQRENT